MSDSPQNNEKIEDNKIIDYILLTLNKKDLKQLARYSLSIADWVKSLAELWNAQSATEKAYKKGWVEWLQGLKWPEEDLARMLAEWIMDFDDKQPIVVPDGYKYESYDGGGWAIWKPEENEDSEEEDSINDDPDEDYDLDDGFDILRDDLGDDFDLDVYRSDRD